MQSDLNILSILPGFPPTAYLRMLYDLTSCTTTEGVSSVKMMILLFTYVEPGPKPVMPQRQINLMLYHSMTAILLEIRVCN